MDGFKLEPDQTISIVREPKRRSRKKTWRIKPTRSCEIGKYPRLQKRKSPKGSRTSFKRRQDSSKKGYKVNLGILEKVG